jgi:hypothetical protein
MGMNPSAALARYQRLAPYAGMAGTLYGIWRGFGETMETGVVAPLLVGASVTSLLIGLVVIVVLLWLTRE